MIDKFKVLARVKATREDAALRFLTSKREELRRAHEIEKQRSIAVQDSEVTLTDRENAIYQPIMKQTVSSQAIDETKDKVTQLQKDHERLQDELEMSVQQCLRLSNEEENARRAYQAAQRVREKYDMMLSDMTHEHSVIAESKEEAEVEELFCKAQSFPL